jgi:cytoskeletal protein CcmA (bactofilin family)
MTARDDGAGQRRFTDGVEGFASVIGPGVAMDGGFSGTTDVRLMGEFSGEMKVDGLVWVGPEARLTGELDAADVLIEGRVTGTVRAVGKIELRASARVEADLTARRIAAAEGSFFEGSVTMLDVASDGMVTFDEKRAAEDRSTPDDSTTG